MPIQDFMGISKPRVAVTITMRCGTRQDWDSGGSAMTKHDLPISCRIGEPRAAFAGAAVLGVVGHFSAGGAASPHRIDTFRHKYGCVCGDPHRSSPEPLHGFSMRAPTHHLCGGLRILPRADGQHAVANGHANEREKAWYGEQFGSDLAAHFQNR